MLLATVVTVHVPLGGRLRTVALDDWLYVLGINLNTLSARGRAFGILRLSFLDVDYRGLVSLLTLALDRGQIFLSGASQKFRRCAFSLCDLGSHNLGALLLSGALVGRSVLSRQHRSLRRISGRRWPLNDLLGANFSLRV